MKRKLLIFTILCYGISAFCQNQSIDKLKQENGKLTKENQVLKNLNDSINKKLSKLQQDTLFLRKELELCSLYGSLKPIELNCSNSNFKFTFISCKGYRSEQKIELTLMVEHKIVNQMITLAPTGYYSEIQMYDSQGNEYNPKGIFIGGKEEERRGNIPTNIPIKIVISFNNILPGNDLIKLLNINFSSSTLDYSNTQKGVLEIKNVKVNWD
ncbi:MAG: hypothetical protein WC868_12620 [Bacteroidales bacterium]